MAAAGKYFLEAPDLAVRRAAKMAALRLNWDGTGTPGLATNLRMVSSVPRLLYIREVSSRAACTLTPITEIDRLAQHRWSAAGLPNASGLSKTEWPIFWRVEGSLADLTAIRPVAYFTWNAQSFTERWARRGGLFLDALIGPVLYSAPTGFLPRACCTPCCGESAATG